MSIMAKLTQEQKEHYLKNPDECPYCHSGDITADHPDFDTNSCSRTVKCNEEDCNKKWIDVYELKDIEKL
ncbi:hypothetical protein [Flavobacterium phage FPSV-S29]|nr:hypothetical protein [Flavobacterium phage FPSV-F12]QCW20704.1 hypothetical protein [Flavobacterium phage FPSV-S29]